MTDPTISPHEPPHIFALLKLFEAVSDEKAERNILEISLPDLREAAARIRELEAEVERLFKGREMMGNFWSNEYDLRIAAERERDALRSEIDRIFEEASAAQARPGE